MLDRGARTRPLEHRSELDGYVSIKIAAEESGYSISAITKQIQKGTIPAVRFEGLGLVVHRETVDLLKRTREAGLRIWPRVAEAPARIGA